MNILDIVKQLELEVIAGYEDENAVVDGVYIGDLLSIVMSKAKSKDLWITVQTHINVVAIATLVELSGVIVVEGMEIDEETINKANEEKIPIFRTKLSAYEVACKLNNMGL